MGCPWMFFMHAITAGSAPSHGKCASRTEGSSGAKHTEVILRSQGRILKDVPRHCSLAHSMRPNRLGRVPEEPEDVLTPEGQPLDLGRGYTPSDPGPQIAHGGTAVSLGGSYTPSREQQVSHLTCLCLN